ncbi:AIPR family protein [Andreprevotia chitinilytica]|uniref:AIPR family protein n=1 Tax=Andreprevotia chitinilytica TaxID=396808 RepID=UPI00068FBAB9|nr:AIPR family protein [Andreprevotia chitinilytica]
MANNDQVILDQIIENERLARMPTATKPDFFEQYVAEQVLKNYDLSDDEVEYGLTGGSHDGGIDGLYTFANGELVHEDFDPTALKRNIVIDVVLLQCKTSNGFDEDSMNKIIALTRDLFALDVAVDNYAGVYNEGVRDGVSCFRQLYQSIAGRFPTLRFQYIYATRGDSREVHPNVQRKVEDLRSAIGSLFTHADFKFEFYGASDLLGLARRQPTTSFDIQFTEILTGRDGNIALVRLQDFINFIRTETGQLRKSLFEANVRDYQGSNQVNEDMQQTLIGRGPEDFWWLNNGVTVVATRAVQGGKVLTIEDPQIVNGQQTSTEIYNYFHAANIINVGNDERCVMVRIIVANDAVSRDRIIKATNSQTSIPAASLRATEKIHRDIEAYLAPFSIFYDRRKNSQKQQGRPTDKIISIGLLAQAMMSIALQRPDDARARPSSLIKKDEDYSQIFDESLPINIYLVAAKIIKTTHSFLRGREDLAPKDRNNLLFYVATHVSSVLTKRARPYPGELARIKVEDIDELVVCQSVAVVEALYRALGANDQVAKGPQLLAALQQTIDMQYPLANAGLQADLF